MITVAIRQKIEARYGKAIRYSKDCEGLSKSIYKYCQERISSTTLKRLLGFAKSIEQPRLFTLDVIASYIGFNDWSCLLANIDKSENFAVPIELKKKEKTLNDVYKLHHQISISLSSQSINEKKIISLCRLLGKQSEIIPFIIEIIGISARQKNIRFLKQIFSLPLIFDEKTHGHIPIYYIGQTMGLMMRSHSDIAEEIIPSLAENINAQKYFIEWFVDEDYLQGYYGKLLDAYHQHKKSKVQDVLFYFALKYSQTVQTGNVIERISWFKKIKKLKIPLNLHEIPAARYTGICLSEEPNNAFNENSKYYRLIQQYLFVEDYDKAIGFTLYLCRELFRSMSTEWLVKVVDDFENHHERTFKKVKTNLDSLAKNELNIYISYVNYLQGKKRKALQYFKSVDPNLFDPFIYQQMHKDYVFVSDKLK